MSASSFTVESTVLQTQVPYYVRNVARACGLCSYKKRKCCSVTLITTASGCPGQLCELRRTNGFESCPPPPDKDDVDKNCTEIKKICKHLKDRRNSRSVQRARREDTHNAQQAQIPVHGTGADVHEAFIPNPNPHLPVRDDTQESIYASNNQAIQTFEGFPSPAGVSSVFHGVPSTAAQHVPQHEQNFHASFASNDATNFGSIMSGGATPVEYNSSLGGTNELTFSSGLGGQGLTAGTIHNTFEVGETSLYGLPQYVGSASTARVGPFAIGVAQNSTYGQLSYPRLPVDTNVIRTGTPKFSQPNYENSHQSGHRGPAHPSVASPLGPENHPPVQGGSYMAASSSIYDQLLNGHYTSYFHQHRGNCAPSSTSNQSFEPAAEGPFDSWNNGASQY